MHRTQIYLHDDLYENLKARSRRLGLSIFELIRRTLEKDIQKNPAANARAYFERIRPLESFASVDSETYVRTVRSSSQMIKMGEAP